MDATFNQAIRFELTHTASESDARRIVAQLGDDAADVIPSLKLSREWVLELQGSSAALANWAVKNCHDPEILAEVAQQKSLRASTKLALRANKDLPYSAQRWLVPDAKLGESPEFTASQHRAKMLVTVKKLLAKHTLKHGDYSTLASVLRNLIDLGDTSWVDETLKKTAATGNLHYVQQYLEYVYSPIGEDDAYVADIYSHVTFTVPAALDLLTIAQRAVVCATVVSSILHREHPPRTQLDSAIFNVAIKTVPPRTPSHFSLSLWLNHDDQKTLLANPRWAHLARLDDLSDDDVHHLARTTFADDPGRLATLFTKESDFSRLPLLVELIPRAVKLDTAFMDPDTLLCAAQELGPNIFDEVLARLSYDAAISVLNGHHDYDSHERHSPPTAWVEPVVTHLETLSREEHYELATISRELQGALSQHNYEYQCALVARAPGLAATLTADDEIGRGPLGGYVFSVLQNVPTPDGAALQMLYQHPELSLRDVRVLCLRLTK